MRALGLCLGILAGGALLSAIVATAHGAPLTAQQRRELVDIRGDVNRAAVYIRQRKTDEAEKALTEAESRLDKLAKDAQADEKDPAIAALRRAIALQRDQLARAIGGAGGAQPAASNEISFTKEIGPVLKARCVSCHGDNNPRANVSLTSFANLKQSNSGNKLFTAGQPQQSNLLGRLTARDARRMPKQGQPLSAEDIGKFSQWIAQGAKFDGKDESVAVGDEGAAEAVAASAPTGNETVSFTKDVAPFMSNLCVRCHSGNNPRGGLSLETYEKLMAGGQSGRVVLPGNLEGSRLWQLAGLQDPIKMPPGNALITRTNHSNLRTWILEGAKYDGGDPKQTLRQLVPTAADIKTAELAKLSDDEFVQHRKTRTDQLWDRVLPKDRASWAESNDFLVYGNVTTERLTEVSGWAEEHAGELRKLFNSKAERLWKGKLAIFVFKDRFGFEEFHTVIQDRRIPQDLAGSSTVTPDFEDAYVVLQDVGDDDTGVAPGLRISLVEHVTGAYLKRTGGNLPDWLVSGVGLSLVGRKDAKNIYLAQLRGNAPDMVHALADPELVFASGTFAPGAVPAVGLTLVEFLQKAGSDQKFDQFVKRLQQGDSVAAAMKTVYNADTKAVAAQYASRLKRPRN
ncbi:MAG: c-type cytochrome domain-containing protein [Planctomycetales bacterium]